MAKLKLLFVIVGLNEHYFYWTDNVYSFFIVYVSKHRVASYRLNFLSISLAPCLFYIYSSVGFKFMYPRCPMLTFFHVECRVSFIQIIPPIKKSYYCRWWIYIYLYTCSTCKSIGFILFIHTLLEGFNLIEWVNTLVSYIPLE